MFSKTDAMTKNSTYDEAFRELVDGANKPLVVWNGLSSIQVEKSRLERLPYVTKAPCIRMGKVIVSRQ
ncbi:hypothetical protein CS060_02240 [Anoxybacillus flavithermus]|uniref:Uncharacterized protein n=1 Tax=Anoxybacillus flavithermus TaxID=33934 RepID=A0A2G5RSY7_9BACL|nr:hypothetical protein JS80_00780 [Anoxybacillus sp. KU2-6(11)]PIC05847.1 hypothetical protein CS060_02240 [Anoxybacillus flavithermus]